MNFKKINIGVLLKQKVSESEIDIFRICNFLQCTADDVLKMYQSESLEADILLRWSKLMGYDFFRIYTQHLILYAPQESANYNQIINEKKSELPSFRKNIYTKELIDFIIEEIDTKAMTINQVIQRYQIPKTTLYKWLEKYKK